MTSDEENGTNLGEGPPPGAPWGGGHGGAEDAYERLAGYGFAGRLLEGKVVANVCRGGLGASSLLLARSAESVVGLSDLPAAVESAALSHPAPTVSYRLIGLPDLALPDCSVGAVVALGVLGGLESPEELVRGAGRLLKEGGLLVVSVPDRRANTGRGGGSSGGRGMHAEEFRELLGRHFRHVRLYRQGAVAGGFVFPASGEMAGAEVEGARFQPARSTADPLLGAGVPATRSVLAVCSDEPLRREQAPYLLVDRDGSVFDESAERAEDVWLLRQEVRQMQETEAQAFLEVLKAQRRQNLADLQKRYLFLMRSVAMGNAAVLRGAVSHLRNVALEEAVHRRNIVRGNVDALKKKGVKGSARGALRRLNLIYGRLQRAIKGHG